MSKERRDHTLQPTALVHEAYLRLIDSTGIDWKGRAHFFAVAALQMRRVLVEHARARRAKKRGGTRVTLDEAIAPAPDDVLDVLALDEALTRLAGRSERQCRVVELRFFAGLSVKETAFVMGISETTVKEQWRLARARLRRELSRNGGAS
jgi:RNA polymerase sigma factor (TIGR02999 family)